MTGLLATDAAITLAGGTAAPPPVVITGMLSVGVVGAAALKRRQWTRYRVGGMQSSLVSLAAIGTIAVGVRSQIVSVWRR